MPESYIGFIQFEGHEIEVSAETEAGTVDVRINDAVYTIESTDAHYLATMLRIAVEMIDFRAQLDARR